jgi:hypothetical protein
MNRIAAVCILLVCCSDPALAQENEYPVIQVPVGAVTKLPSALAYSLLPSANEMKPGNAVTAWLRATHLAREVRPALPDNEADAWTKQDGKLSLKASHREKIRQALQSYRIVLQLADDAARRRDSNWDWPDLPQRDAMDVVLSDTQAVRWMANILRAQIRFDLSEGRLDNAGRTLQTGFALARYAGSGPSPIHALVGIAIASLMIGEVDEFIQQPDAPPLYWPLTALPRPFTDLRQPLGAELARMGRSFPFLADASKSALTAQAATEILAKGLHEFDPQAGVQSALMGMGTVAGVYPEAKRTLLAQGYDAKKVDAMTQAQVVAGFLGTQFVQMRDDLLKWISLPYWQGYRGLDELVKKYDQKTPPRNLGSALFGLALPSYLKVYAACARTDRLLAALRCAEAIRLHAATHEGKLPKTLSEIIELPLPIDPITGKGMDSWYQLRNDGTGVFLVPPPPTTPTPLLGRRYELKPR